MSMPRKKKGARGKKKCAVKVRMADGSCYKGQVDRNRVPDGGRARFAAFRAKAQDDGWSTTTANASAADKALPGVLTVVVEDAGGQRAERTVAISAQPPQPGALSVAASGGVVDVAEDGRALISGVDVAGGAGTVDGCGVDEVLEVMQTFEDIVKHSFDEDKAFSRCYKKAVEFFLNIDVAPAQALVSYADSLFKKGLRGKTDEEIER